MNAIKSNLIEAMPASAQPPIELKLYSPDAAGVGDVAGPGAAPSPSAGESPVPNSGFPGGKVDSPIPSAAWLAEQSARLEGATPPEIIGWAVEHYFPRLTMATAFGPEGCLILHWLAEIEPRTAVFNLDTGYQFPETLKLRDRIAERYGIVVELKQPELTVEAYEALHGGPLYRTDPDRCCFDRKIKVLRQAAVGMDAWMSGIRRDQSADRAQAPIVGWDRKFELVKISPLANSTKAQVWKMIVDHDIPYNPLHDQGYSSIGCWPCTRSVMFGEDERAGRWSGTAKTECGLHTRDS